MGKRNVLDEDTFKVFLRFIEKGQDFRSSAIQTGISKTTVYKRLLEDPRSKKRLMQSKNLAALEREKKKIKRVYQAENKAVYIVRLKDHDIYKIGLTNRKFERRLVELTHNFPFEIEKVMIIFTISNQRLESRLHKKFANKRLRGEWFKLTDEDLTFIKTMPYSKIVLY